MGSKKAERNKSENQETPVFGNIIKKLYKFKKGTFSLAPPKRLTKLIRRQKINSFILHYEYGPSRQGSDWK